MIVLITGASHTGKTLLAQKLLEKHGFPYLSIDLLKMGLIRSKNTDLTVEDDEALTEYLWPIVCEIIKTAIENNQNLVIEVCYIPFDWKKYFDESYLKKIRYYCLIMSKKYIQKNFDTIKKKANVIENRIDDSWIEKGKLIALNEHNQKMCEKYACDYIFINDNYSVNPDITDFFK